MENQTEIKKGTLMTEGSIPKQIILFALPLLLGNIFQQLYNTADSIIVGNIIGSNALAAVSSSFSLIMMITSLLMGITLGASVVIANYYGAGELTQMKDAIHTAIAFGMVASVVISIVGLLFSPTILKWMGTPSNLMESSVLYLRIIFLGMFGNMMYNVGSSIFRAVGDSKRPLYYLIFCSILNIGLDLLFVAVFRMGIAGAALATIIAQLVSAGITFRTLIKEKTEYQIDLKEIRFHPKELRLIINIGLPSGIQNAIVSFSNVVVQANINAFGAMAMAGCGSYNKIDGFAVMPAMSFSMALTTFIGQNLGANKPDRMKKGARFGIIASMVTVEIGGILIYAFAPFLVRLFQSNPQVIEYGVEMARTIAPFYFLLALSHSMAGTMRGAGLSNVPMLVMVICWCGMRVTWITAAVHFIKDIHIVFLGYPLTWLASAIIFLIYYKKKDWVHHSIVG
ncbi:MAG: MATE family efflux transporter [Lachnospiraceae bacterium]